MEFRGKPGELVVEIQRNFGRSDGELEENSKPVPKIRHHSSKVTHRGMKAGKTKRGIHAVNHLKIDELKEIPGCREEYTCDAHRTRSLGDYARKHIAVQGSETKG